MDYSKIITDTSNYVKGELHNAEGGHDRRHIYRVWKMAKHIAQHEEVNMLIVELGALLHDIADSKFHNGDEEIGPRKAKEFLRSLSVSQEVIEGVVNIVQYISFKSGSQNKEYTSKELDVVQDPDRLDAMGAIGIARTFNYGGFKGREIYNPNIEPNLNMTKDEYKNNTAPTINHFYEKLLLLRSLMNTETGKNIAQHRHEVMENYLEEFYKEREGEL